MSFTILNNPLLTTIQDSGRKNLTHLGITNSGVMDMFAYKIANHLLNNPSNTNILEIYYGNITLQVNEDTIIALTGAHADITLNNKSIIMYQSQKVKKGDILKIGKVHSGLIVYLSVKDGFNLEKQLGSTTTTIKEKIGGRDGSKLKKGDTLHFNSCDFHIKKRLKSQLIPEYNDVLELRVMLSYQNQYFNEEETTKFFNEPFEITPQISRMGYKLQGTPIKADINGIISEGIAYGSIQIPNDGQPIILLKEHQTIGGYPKIGVVLDVDCYKLSQAKPNTKIYFKAITFNEAISISKKFHNSLN